MRTATEIAALLAVCLTLMTVGGWLVMDSQQRVSGAYGREL